MSRGPLPTKNPRRRNAPTIPTTELPASGRTAPPPELPTSMPLDRAGFEWWDWAWTTPQACGWSDGDTFMVARRASLEDDLDALARVQGLDLLEMLDAEVEAVFRSLIGRLAALCGGRLALLREMRELDDRLGLTPKGLANLRWTIIDDRADEANAEPELDLAELTVKELKRIAAERRVALPPRAKKADVLAALEAPAAESNVSSLTARRRRLTG